MTGKNTWDKVRNNIDGFELTLGTYFSRQIFQDPKHVLFTLSRYKFVAKMLGEKSSLSVVEFGCNEGLGTQVLSISAKKVVGIDFDEEAIASAKKNFASDVLSYKHGDFLSENFGTYDAVVSLDVIEHISREQEGMFMQAIAASLNDTGFCVLGTPNVTAAQYACKASEIGHINLYDAERFKELCAKYFHNVFLFGMNDEVVHTGFSPMCHYLFVLACNKKR